MKVNINDRNITKVKELLDKGFDRHQIVELIGGSYSTIDRIIQKITGKRHQRLCERKYLPPFTEEEIRKVDELMNEGSSKIARMMNRPQSTIHRMMYFIKLSRADKLNKDEMVKIKRYLRLSSFDATIEKLHTIKKALGEENNPLREDLIEELFTPKQFLWASTQKPSDGGLNDLRDEFNTRLTSMQMQIEILTETIMEIKNGKNN